MTLPKLHTTKGLKVLDWVESEKLVRTLRTREIESMIHGLRISLPSADLLDREQPESLNDTAGGRGGLYRDEISVLSREIGRRLTHGKVCGECGK